MTALSGSSGSSSSTKAAPCSPILSASQRLISDFFTPAAATSSSSLSFPERYVRQKAVKRKADTPLESTQQVPVTAVTSTSTSASSSSTTTSTSTSTAAVVDTQSLPPPQIGPKKRGRRKKVVLPGDHARTMEQKREEAVQSNLVALFQPQGSMAAMQPTEIVLQNTITYLSQFNIDVLARVANYRPFQDMRPRPSSRVNKPQLIFALASHLATHYLNPIVTINADPDTHRLFGSHLDQKQRDSELMDFYERAFTALMNRNGRFKYHVASRGGVQTAMRPYVLEYKVTRVKRKGFSAQCVSSPEDIAYDLKVHYHSAKRTRAHATAQNYIKTPTRTKFSFFRRSDPRDPPFKRSVDWPDTCEYKLEMC